MISHYQVWGLNSRHLFSFQTIKSRNSTRSCEEKKYIRSSGTTSLKKFPTLIAIFEPDTNYSSIKAPVNKAVTIDTKSMRGIAWVSVRRSFYGDTLFLAALIVKSVLINSWSTFFINWTQRTHLCRSILCDNTMPFVLGKSTQIWTIFVHYLFLFYHLVGKQYNISKSKLHCTVNRYTMFTDCNRYVIA